MALARSEVARWWSLRSLGAPSRIVAGLSIEEFHPAAAATAAPRRSGLDTHTSESSPRWVCMYAGEMFTATEVVRSWASWGREAAAAGTALSFQIPASHPTRCSRLDPHRHPASPAVARGSLFGARDVELHIGSARRERQARSQLHHLRRRPRPRWRGREPQDAARSRRLSPTPYGAMVVQGEAAE